jgi:hypothetical protein
MHPSSTAFAAASNDAVALRERLLRERADVDSRLAVLQSSRSALASVGAPSALAARAPSREPSRGLPPSLAGALNLSLASGAVSSAPAAARPAQPYARYAGAPPGVSPSASTSARGVAYGYGGSAGGSGADAGDPYNVSTGSGPSFFSASTLVPVRDGGAGGGGGGLWAQDALALAPTGSSGRDDAGGGYAKAAGGDDQHLASPRARQPPPQLTDYAREARGSPLRVSQALRGANASSVNRERERDAGLSDSSYARRRGDYFDDQPQQQQRGDAGYGHQNGRDGGWRDGDGGGGSRWQQDGEGGSGGGDRWRDGRHHGENSFLREGSDYARGGGGSEHARGGGSYSRYGGGGGGYDVSPRYGPAGGNNNGNGRELDRSGGYYHQSREHAPAPPPLWAVGPPPQYIGGQGAVWDPALNAWRLLQPAAQPAPSVLDAPAALQSPKRQLSPAPDQFSRRTGAELSSTVAVSAAGSASSVQSRHGAGSSAAARLGASALEASEFSTAREDEAISELLRMPQSSLTAPGAAEIVQRQLKSLANLRDLKLEMARALSEGELLKLQTRLER